MEGLFKALITFLMFSPIAMIYWFVENQPDRGRCLETQIQTYTYQMPMYTYNPDGTMSLSYFMPMDMTGPVCVRWEFPEGKK